MLVVIDILFILLHIFVIGFNLTGWIWKKTRKIHLWTVVATFVSWFALGLFYGLGYCFLTDWHWEVKRKLGEKDLPGSFIQYLLENFGFSVDPNHTDMVTGIVFLLVILITVYVNFIRKH